MVNASSTRFWTGCMVLALSGCSVSSGSSDKETGSPTMDVYDANSAPPDTGVPSGTDGSAAEVETAGAAGAEGVVDVCGKLDNSKPLQLFLSADDSNSMASPAIARSIIKQGGIPPAGLIRTYEFLNYYDLGYERAAKGELALFLEMKEGGVSGSYALELAVSSEAAVFVRRPMNITFVLDTSGSMDGVPIERSRATVKAIATSLKKGDIVSAVTWNDSNNVVLNSLAVSGPSDPEVVGMANDMKADGSTNLNAGLAQGYALAQKNLEASHLNRVVLISDGLANTGVTDEDIIAKGADLNDGDGVYLVGVGVGDGVDDILMNVVTDKGRGAYVYLDSNEEANHMFVDRFDETMDVAARAVQVRLDLPWYLTVTRFYGERMSTNPKLVEPQHLAPNDAMVFDQLLHPCSDSALSLDDPVAVTVNLATPTDHQSRSQSLNATIGEHLEGTANHMPKSAAIIAYAEALKAGATASTVEPALAKVKAAKEVRDDAELAKIEALLKTLRERF
jgi:Ca-activated chloride channel homolog